jgi:4-hydroxybenzoate polyprenyltransferase
MFSAFSTSFAFIINDIFDEELDRSAGIRRNPLSTGEISPRMGLPLALIFLFASLSIIPLLCFENRLLGLALVFLYATYSWHIRAKARPPLDILYHGLCLALLGMMGYLEYGSFDMTCFLFGSLAFFLSATSQILQEVRDYETDRKMLKTTVTQLGKKKSLILSLLFLASAQGMFFLLLLHDAFPLGILILSPFAYFIVAPIIRAIHKVGYEKEELEEIRRRRLFLILLAITFLILGRLNLDF